MRKVYVVSLKTYPLFKEKKTSHTGFEIEEIEASESDRASLLGT